LTRRLARGDEAAYREFHHAYFDRLSRYLLVVARGDEQAAREALQGSLIRLARHARVFSDEAIFWSWLTVLARSSLADGRRSSRRYLAFLERFRMHRHVEVDDRSEGHLEELLAGHLAALSEEERRLIERKYFEHMSVRSIAEASMTTEKAVESSLGRIRRKLKEAVLAELRNERRD
jgi:RNA polymerase sigma-70 factor (ECF subfamily)